MSIFTSFRESLYDSFEELFPTYQVIYSYGNNPEHKTPYILYSIDNTKNFGEEYTPTLVGSDGMQQIVSQYTSKVTLEFIGKSDDFTAADLANDFYFTVDYFDTQSVFYKNALSYMRKSSVRKVPKRRETVWYMSYQIDLYFGYQVEARQNTGVIESVVIEETLEFDNERALKQTIKIPEENK